MRFAVSAPNDPRLTRNDVAGRILVLRYVCEKSHLPVEHGDLEFDLSGATWVRQHSDPRIQKMADCFLDSYLKKKA